MDWKYFWIGPLLLPVLHPRDSPSLPNKDLGSVGEAAYGDHTTISLSSC